MTDNKITTPFGGGRFSAANFMAQMSLAKQREQVKQNANQLGKADKWAVLKALSESRLSFSLSDRAIAVLSALLAFHPEKELDGSEPIIVFPSNKQLSAKLHEMPEVSIRRHIRALVAAGMIVRRDSANGKRYRTRDESGEPADVFGFDISPMILKAPEIFDAQDHTRAHLKAVQKVRTEITIHLRDISNIIGTALEESRSGNWQDFQMQLHALSGRVGRTTPLDELTTRKNALVQLRKHVEDTYLNSIEEQELNANDAHFERHIQNSKTEPIFENTKIKEVEITELHEARLETKSVEAIDLHTILKACPDIIDYSTKGSIDSWQDISQIANTVRPMLGISHNAWEEAVSAMGKGDALTTLVAIVQKGAEIRSAGGYLRALTQRARAGKFSPYPMIEALLNQKRDDLI